MGPRSTGAALVSAPFSDRGRSFVDACADSRGRNTILHGNAEGLYEERDGNRGNFARTGPWSIRRVEDIGP